MAEYQAEVEFQIEGRTRDIDLLERLADELERTVGEMGPAVAIHGDRYSVTLAVVDESAVSAARRAADVISTAAESVLGATVEWHVGRLAVDEELVPA